MGDSSLVSERAGPQPFATRRRLADRHVGILFMAPFVLLAAPFLVYPIASSVWLAFHSLNPLTRDIQFVGLENFVYILTDPLFWAAFKQAAIWTGSSILLQTFIGVGLALLLNQQLRGINFFRGLFLFPYVVPTIVIALVWRWMFNPDIGIVNYTALQLGLVSGQIPWFSDPHWAMFSTILLNVWKFTPFVVICVLARLQTIPEELYDAASVDGAHHWRMFWDITLPQLKPVLAVVVIFRTIWTFNKFEEIFLLTRGGPGTSTYNLAVYAYEQSIANMKMGAGAATGVVMLGFLFLGTLAYLRLFRFAEEEG